MGKTVNIKGPKSRQEQKEVRVSFNEINEAYNLCKQQNEFLWKTVRGLADILIRLTGREESFPELKLLPGGKKVEEQPTFAD